MGPSICPLKAIIAKVGGSLHGVFLFKGMFQRREVRVEEPQHTVSYHQQKRAHDNPSLIPIAHDIQCYNQKIGMTFFMF